MKVELYPVRLTLLDDNHNPEIVILAYETGYRVNAAKLPEGWQRCAWRDNGGDGDDDTIEMGVTVNHLADFITQSDIRSILSKHDGAMYMGPYADAEPSDHVIEMDSVIYER